MKHKLLLLLVVSVFSVIFCATDVFAIPVDLSTFDLRDDNDIVYFGIDNSSAEIKEDINWDAPLDPSIGPVTLLDYDLPVPADAMSLTFDYELVVAPYNEDYFDFYFDDLSAYSNTFGGHNDTDTNLIYAGAVTRDLTGFAGSTLELAFALNWGFDDGYTYDVVDEYGWPTPIGNKYASVLTISNVEINPVPEPATLLLLGSGLIGLARIRKKVAA